MPNVYINEPFIKAFHTQPYNTARFFYNIGGRWSGKTYQILQEMIIRSLQNPGLRQAVIRKVYASIKDSVYQEIIAICQDMGLNKGEHYDYTVSPLCVTFHNGNSIIFKGLDDPEKMKGLAGVHEVFIEEANELSLQEFETINMSIRGKNFNHRIYLAHNPIMSIPGSEPWFKTMFGAKELIPGEPVFYDDPNIGKITSLKTTYQNNAFCPETVQKMLEGYKNTNPGLYRLWACGDYAELEGLIYSGCWDIVSKIPAEAELLTYSVDFGFSNDPAAVMAIYVNKKTRELFLKGLIYQRGLINDELYQKMVEKGIKSSDCIIADSSEPKTIEDFYRKGFKGIRKVNKKPGYKTEMINIIKGYKLHILEGDIDLYREISTYAWQKDKNGKDLPVPTDGNDHYMDCLTMGCHEKLGKNYSAITFSLG